MSENKKRRLWGIGISIIAIVLLLFGALWWGTQPEKEEGDVEEPETEEVAKDEEVHFKERPVEIDYSKEPEEILAMYTEEGMNLFKVNFPDTLSMHYALKNIGKNPTEIKGKLMNGEEFTLSEYADKNIILIFSKTTCSICKEMGPILAEIEEENPDVMFVNIFPVDNKKDIEGFYKDLKMELPKYVMSLEDNEGLKDLAIDEYKVEQVPTFVFVDNTGKISYTYIGSKDKIMFQDMIDTAFGEKKLYDYVRMVTVRVDEDGNEIVEEELIDDNLIDEDSVDHDKEDTPNGEGSGENEDKKE